MPGSSRAASSALLGAVISVCQAGCGTADGAGLWEKPSERVAVEAGSRPEGGAPDSNDGTTESSLEAERFLETLRARYMVDFTSSPMQPRFSWPGDPPTGRPSLIPEPMASSIVRDSGKLVPVFAASPRGPSGPTSLSLPPHADGPLELKDDRTGMRLASRVVGARATAGEIARGYVLYRDALPHGVSIVHLPMPTGTEDLLTIEGPETTSVSYDIDLGEGVAGLRLFADTLELLDSKGMPRLRVSPPYLLDSKLKRHGASLSLSRCVADHSPAPPWSHAVVAPGATSCRLTVSWNATDVEYPALLDPTWTSTGSMAVGRIFHTAGLLDDGTVIVAGGISGLYVLGAPVTSAERFRLEADGTGAWTAAAPLKGGPHIFGYGVVSRGRFYLLEGAIDFCTNSANSEYFSTSTNDWTLVTIPSINPPRPRSQDATATLMQDGRILIAGGTDSVDCGRADPWTPKTAVDIYDPDADRWARAPDLPVRRAEHTAALAADGRTLLVGGRDFPYGDYVTPWLRTTVFYDPARKEWSDGPALNHGHRFHGTVSLSTTSPDVLVFGGPDDQIWPIPDVATYGTTERWTGGATFRQINPGFLHRRQWNYGPGWTQLLDGSVMAVFGWGPTYGYRSDAEIFDPVTETWSATGALTSLLRPFYFTITTLEPSGHVLVAGGVDVGAPIQASLARAEADLYDGPPALRDGGAEADSGGPPVSQFCGDSIRDPVLEECDRGATLPPRSTCSAECRVVDLPAVAEPGDTPESRALGEGRHPLATNPSGGFAVVFTEPDSKPLRLGLTTFSNDGVASDTVVPISTGSTPLLMSAPVVASVPGNKYVVAYTDFDGDGDELGVALRSVDPNEPPTGAPIHANVTTHFSQYDADLISTRAGLVVAWVDDSDAANGPDIKLRTFDFALVPTSKEQVLAGTAANEGDVALAPFGNDWAAAWRAGESGMETLHVQQGTIHWTVGPFQPGPVGDRPALAQVDGSRLLAVYTEGIDRPNTGVANGSKLRAILLDTAEPGSVSGAFDVVSAVSAGPGQTLSQSQPNAIRTGGGIFIGWRAESVSGDSQGEELWLKQVAWTAPSPNLDWSAPEQPLPRWPVHGAGDQRHPAFAVAGTRSGPELVTAYEDFGRNFDANGKEIVAVEAIPIPRVRLPTAMSLPRTRY
jgi:hypothetical protein